VKSQFNVRTFVMIQNKKDFSITESLAF